MRPARPGRWRASPGGSKPCSACCGTFRGSAPRVGGKTPLISQRHSPDHPQSLLCVDTNVVLRKGAACSGNPDLGHLGEKFGAGCQHSLCTLVIPTASSEPGANTEAIRCFPIHPTQLRTSPGWHTPGPRDSNFAKDGAVHTRTKGQTRLE